MKCEQVYAGLDAVSRGQPIERTLLDRLISMKLAERVSQDASSASELDQAKSQMGPIKGEIKRLKSLTLDSSGKERLASLQKEDAQLRAKVLFLVQKQAQTPMGAGPSPGAVLTWRGREAHHFIGARIPAADDSDWEELEKAMEQMTTKLSSEAQESAAILKLISKELSGIDEFYLRASAVGLASIEGLPDVKAKKFIDYARRFSAPMFFNPAYQPLAAESALALEVEKDLGADSAVMAVSSTMDSLLRAGIPAGSEMFSICLLLMRKSAEERDRLITNMASLFGLVGSNLGALLLMLDSPAEDVMGARLDLFSQWKSYFLPMIKEAEINDLVVASSLLSTANGGTEEAGRKFEVAQGYLKELFEENMMVAAATIALWPATVEESLDNIRLAASQILNNKLSVGGIENFSLGIKLLSNNTQFVSKGQGASFSTSSGTRTGQSSISPGVVAVGAAVGVAVATTAILATPLLMRGTFNVFHALTVQEHAFVDFRYHPAHSNYLYG